MPFTDPYVQNPYPYSYAQTLTLANTLYDVNEALVAGVYTISWSGGGNVTVDFYNGTSLIGTANGVSPITFNLAQPATNYKMWNTVSNSAIVISLSGLAIGPTTGTLYTFTTSQTISLVGGAYYVLWGGGGGGGGGSSALNGGGGGGGSSGGYASGKIFLNGSNVLTIGQGGAGGGVGVAGSPGTPTYLGSNNGAAGVGGSPGNNSGTGGAGASSPYFGAVGAGGASGLSTPAGSSGTTAPNNYIYPIFNGLNTGGGGGGGAAAPPTGVNLGSAGGGLGVGTGGAGGNWLGPLNTPNGGNGIGYGAGGGGGAGSGGLGGAGSQGVCYIII